MLSIGANLGTRKQNILNAVNYLKSSNVLSNVTLSSFYETEPVGYTEQPWFLNIAVTGYTDCSLISLIALCKKIELSLGRKVRQHWHEREIDIDIIFYGNKCENNSVVTVPHPRMHERKFVLIPAAEIAGGTIDPESGKTIKELLAECEDDSIVNKF
ncbi:MAG: 2-amino-4-hydroxy-6-hydroxymethyldihydropteridine diphosphokinase [FCB group bacterium]|jgi:2-amino-4-hydroxy-6-hydroxymethyldihydropteridine diphosphokinase